MTRDLLLIKEQRLVLTGAGKCSGAASAALENLGDQVYVLQFLQQEKIAQIAERPTRI